MTAALTDCRYCIDTHMPAGHDDALGELYERCPVCTQPCPRCDGIAVYPANYNTPLELAADLTILRLAPKNLITVLAMDIEALAEVHPADCPLRACQVCIILADALAAVDAHDGLQPSGCACPDHITYPRRAAEATA